MHDPIDPADAARALSEIDRRREQVIRREVFTGWFWWGHAVLLVVLAASIESGRDVLIGIGIAVFVAGSLLVDLPVQRAARAAPTRRDLAGRASPGVPLVGLAFVLVLIGLAVTTGLSLKAAGVPYPGTIAAAVAGVAFAVGGQMLVRYEMAVLVRRGSEG